MSIKALTFLSFALVTATAHAQVRVFNPETGQNALVTSSTPPAIGGLRFGSTTSGALLPPRETPSSPSTPTTSAPPPAPVIIRPVAPSSTAPQFGPLGSAMVLVPLRPTTAMLANLKKILQVPGLTVVPTFHHAEVKEIWGLTRNAEIFTGNLPPETSFDVDIDGVRAKALGIPPGQPTIAYRDPTGAVRLYKLVAEYAMFNNHLDRIRSELNAKNAR